ncbi:virulence factor MviN [Lacinutrix sp. C3R15]|uniref:murein biosynthesis integral membrane protein MurJ n=1 Tax=Flavobacteriaceae TaxID=49546 RepID=UPI001C093F0E|nr:MULTISPECIES: lipid II flippase MurJ [Flavobacteriaceae]MBU2938617.1 virulence factor MviN [Lacinutrix sp. C3R15]MDO6621931.1 lipid II flippase MurJ [Oceanihabitans sp. 1_MG-2023]
MKLSNYIPSLKKAIKNPTVINIITVAVISIVVKGLGFYKEIIVAGSFGLSELLDTFFIAALLPGFINEVFLNAFKAVFIPNYIAEKKSTNKIGAFQSASFIITLSVAAIFIIISYLFTDVFLETFFKGHTPDYYALITTQLYYLLPCILFWGFASLISGLLNIYDEFKYASIYPVFTSIAMIVCLVFFKEQLQEKVLAIGMLIGSISQFIFLLIVAINKQIIKIAKPDFLGFHTQTMFKQVPAKVSSGFLTGLISVTDQFFAAQLIIGSITALNYGLRIPAFFTAIIVMALGNVLLPYFSKLSLTNKDEAFKKLYYILKRLFLGLIVVSVVLIFLSDFIVELFFERNEFSSEDTKIVANIQRMFLIGLPFTICGNIIVRFLTSINKNTFMAYISFVTVLLNIVLDIVLMKYYGVFGIALCTALLQVFRSLVYLKYTTNQQKVLAT